MLLFCFFFPQCMMNLLSTIGTLCSCISSLRLPGGTVCWQERKEIRGRHPAQYCRPHTFSKTHSQMSERRACVSNYRSILYGLRTSLHSRHSSCQRATYVKASSCIDSRFFSSIFHTSRKENRNWRSSSQTMTPVCPSIQPGKIRSVLTAERLDLHFPKL